eukprot:404484_1
MTKVFLQSSCKYIISILLLVSIICILLIYYDYFADVILVQQLPSPMAQNTKIRNKSIELTESYAPYVINNIECGKIYNFSTQRTKNHVKYSYSIAILTMNINNIYPKINQNITFNRLIYAQQHHYMYIEINNITNNLFNTSILNTKAKDYIQWS